MQTIQTRAVRVERNEPACYREEHAFLCVIMWFLCHNQHVLYTLGKLFSMRILNRKKVENELRKELFNALKRLTKMFRGERALGPVHIECGSWSFQNQTKGILCNQTSRGLAICGHDPQ